MTSPRNGRRVEAREYDAIMSLLRPVAIKLRTEHRLAPDTLAKLFVIACREG